MFKKFKVTLTKYPVEMIIDAKTEEDAIRDAKSKVDFSIWESSAELIDS